MSRDNPERFQYNLKKLYGNPSGARATVTRLHQSGESLVASQIGNPSPRQILDYLLSTPNSEELSLPEADPCDQMRSDLQGILGLEVWNSILQYWTDKNLKRIFYTHGAFDGDKYEIFKGSLSILLKAYEASPTLPLVGPNNVTSNGFIIWKKEIYTPKGKTSPKKKT